VNVVDSSGWLEYLADGPNADFFASPIIATRELVVPTLSIYEVFKRVLSNAARTTLCKPWLSCNKAWLLS